MGCLSLCKLSGVKLCTLFGVFFEYGRTGGAYGRGPKAPPVRPYSKNTPNSVQSFTPDNLQSDILCEPAAAPKSATLRSRGCWTKLSYKATGESSSTGSLNPRTNSVCNLKLQPYGR